MILFCLFAVYLCWIRVVVFDCFVLGLMIDYGYFVLVVVWLRCVVCSCFRLSFLVFFIWRLWIWWNAILIVDCDCVCLYVGLVFILDYVVCFCFNGVVMLCIGAVCFALLVLCGLFCIWWFALLFCLWLCWLFVFVCFVVKRYLVDCFMVLGLCLIVVVRVSSVCCLFEFVFCLFWVVY